MFDIKEYERRKKIITAKKEQLARDEGKLESLVDRLKDEFDCTVEEAPTKRAELMKKKEKLEVQLTDIETELDAYDWRV